MLYITNISRNVTSHNTRSTSLHQRLCSGKIKVRRIIPWHSLGDSDEYCHTSIVTMCHHTTMSCSPNLTDWSSLSVLFRERQTYQVKCWGISFQLNQKLRSSWQPEVISRKFIYIWIYNITGVGLDFTYYFTYYTVSGYFNTWKGHRHYCTVTCNFHSNNFFTLNENLQNCFKFYQMSLHRELKMIEMIFSERKIILFSKH